MWRARSLGGDEHFGWSVDTYLLASLVDAAHSQLKGKRLQKHQRVQRPEVVEKKPERRKFDPHVPVKNLDFDALFPE